MVGYDVVTVALAKPPYRVPSMEEIRALPWNGLTAASTFSGCGGSSLGYRIAGFRVLYASEFVPEAQATYRANAAPYTYLDDRDIREVTPGDVLDRCGLKAGDLDLLDGSPPCASFSTAGKRHEGWGIEKTYSDTVQRSDDLFFEFARLLDGVQPRTFVAENVSGLVKGTAKGYFIEIMRRLKGCGYRIEAKLLDAQWLGVPQARQRLIFVGARSDIEKAPAFPDPLPYRYAVRDVLDEHGVIAQGDNGAFGRAGIRRATAPSGTIGATPQTGNGLTPPSLVVSEGPLTHDPETGKDLRITASYTANYNRLEPGRPSPTILTHDRGFNAANLTTRRFTLSELRRVCGFPDDFALTGTYEQRWERLGRAVPPVMMSHIAAAIRDRVLS